MPTSACSSSLRLYRSTGYGGSALFLTTRSVVQNLSSFWVRQRHQQLPGGGVFGGVLLGRESVRVAVSGLDRRERVGVVDGQWMGQRGVVGHHFLIDDRLAWVRGTPGCATSL